MNDKSLNLVIQCFVKEAWAGVVPVADVVHGAKTRKGLIISSTEPININLNYKTLQNPRVRFHPKSEFSRNTLYKKEMNALKTRPN